MTTLNPSLPATGPDGDRPASTRLDRLGIVASAACVVHCLATPVLLLMVPVMGAWWSHPAAHWGLAALVLPLAMWVVFRGYRRHRRRSALITAGLGAGLIVAGLILPEIDGPAPLNFTVPAPLASDTVAATATPAPAEPEPTTWAAFHAEAASDADAHAGGTDAPACTETCCPIVTYDAPAGQASLTVPAGTLATLLGSLFLVAAHGINLHGCRCVGRSAVDATDGACGCPTRA